jgi:hypothetical protein
MARLRDVAKDFLVCHTCRSSQVGAATMPKVKNPHVFMDISISGGSAERITFEVVKLAAACVVCFVFIRLTIFSSRGHGNMHHINLRRLFCSYSQM